MFQLTAFFLGKTSKTANSDSLMKILFLLGARSEWGYIRPLIVEAIKRNHEPLVCATNMAVQIRYSSILEELQKMEIPIIARISSAFEGDSHVAMAKSIGAVTLGFSDVLDTAKPNWVVLAGDRYEQLGAAIACSYMYVPTSHVQSGEKSGNIDGVARHAITKLVHLHFTANPDASERVFRMGEEKFRIHETGAPQLDSLLNDSRPSRNQLVAQNIAPQEDYLLVVFHPVTEEFSAADFQIAQLKGALDKFNYKKIWILPNNDPGGLRIREFLLTHQNADERILNNVARPTYASLLEHSFAIVGNSSSGILEAPSFGRPAINIGSRQRDRFRGSNVIDVERAFENEIIKALDLCSNDSFLSMLAKSKNPYGDGKSSPRILDILENTPIDQRLLAKRLDY